MIDVTLGDLAAQASGGDALDGANGLDEQLVAQLSERARAQGLSLVGEGGLLARLTKIVLESATEGEMDAHLGYAKHDPAGRDGGNSRNGTRAKTVLTDVGPVHIEVPRDRDASFCPQLVKKRQRRLLGVDSLVCSLSAKGLTTGEISAHLAEVYDASRNAKLRPITVGAAGSAKVSVPPMSVTNTLLMPCPSDTRLCICASTSGRPPAPAARPPASAGRVA